MRKIRTGTSETDTNEIDTKCKGDLMDKLKQNYEEILELVFKISYLCLACDIYFYNLYITNTANPCEIDISVRIICDFGPYYKLEEI